MIVTIDISDIVSRKEALIKNYKSQFQSRLVHEYKNGMNAWNSRFLNKKNKAWAECFFVQSMIEYENFFKDIFKISLIKAINKKNLILKPNVWDL